VPRDLGFAHRTSPGAGIGNINQRSISDAGRTLGFRLAARCPATMANLPEQQHLSYALSYIHSVGSPNAKFPRRIGGGTASLRSTAGTQELAAPVKSAPTTVGRVENVYGAKPRSVEEHDDEH
jgi:hypothetical protein